MAGTCSGVKLKSETSIRLQAKNIFVYCSVQCMYVSSDIQTVTAFIVW